MSASPAVAPLSDVPKVVQSLYQLTNSIQKQHSPHLRPFVEGEIQFVGYTDQHDNLQARLTLSVEIGLDLILAFFIGNTSSLTDLGQEYKWCPAGNIMGSTETVTWCGITRITKAVSWWQVSRTSVQLGEPNGKDGTWTMTGTKCAAIKRLISIMRSR